MIATPYKSTISTAASSYDLTVLETVKTELDITNTDNDAKLATLIRSASAAISTWLNRVLAEEVLIDSFRLDLCDDATELLLLSRRPVTAIASIVEDGVTLTSDDYEYEGTVGKLWRLDGSDNRRCWEPAKVVVTFTAGYALLDALPEDIERACIELVKQGWFALKRDPLVKAEDVPGVLSTQYWVGSIGDNGALPPNVLALLTPYRSLAV